MTGTRRHLILLLLLLFPGLVFAQTVPPDVEGYWAEGRIRELITRQIVEVFPDGTFRPQETLSRARFVAWLVAVKGLPLLRADPPDFPDVPPSFPLAAQIETANAHRVLPPMAQFRPTAAPDPLDRPRAGPHLRERVHGQRGRTLRGHDRSPRTAARDRRRGRPLPPAAAARAPLGPAAAAGSDHARGGGEARLGVPAGFGAARGAG